MGRARERGKGADGEIVLIAFGAPHKGITKTMNMEEAPISEFDYLLDTIPDQGTETVRTEEAVVATLAILNMALH